MKLLSIFSLSLLLVLGACASTKDSSSSTKSSKSSKSSMKKSSNSQPAETVRNDTRKDDVVEGVPADVADGLRDAAPANPGVERTSKSSLHGAMTMKPEASQYDEPGFSVYEADGRLWVFRDGSKALGEYLSVGEPAKSVTRIGTGPKGMSLRSDETDVLDAYEAAWQFGKGRYAIYSEDGRLWIFEDGSQALADFRRVGEPAKRVTRIGEGPSGETLIAPDTEILDAFVAEVKYGREGFTVVPADGRLWVFADGSEHFETFRTKGEPAKRVTWIGAGPGGVTLMGAEREVLAAYATPERYGAKGFEVIWEDGRLWIFRSGSADFAEFNRVGEPAKRVTLVGAGPDGRTVMAPDRETVSDYLEARR